MFSQIALPREINRTLLLPKLNSNKEHLRYVARIHVLPEVYKRSEEEHIPMKELFCKIVGDCDEVIDICRSIRLAFEMQLRAIYGNVSLPKSQANQLSGTAV